MDNPPETKYEEYFHRKGRDAELREEFDRRQRDGWSLWKTDPARDGGALLQFKYQSDWSAQDQGARAISPDAGFEE